MGRTVDRFATIAAEHGDRWLEVPFEALLTLGDAESAIRELWASLTADESAALATLLRLADSRYVSGTFGDPYALAPLVSVTFCDPPTAISSRRLGHQRTDDVIQDLVLAWLRGMASAQPQPDSRRQAVRDTILSNDPEPYDDFAIDALATLGPDLLDPFLASPKIWQLEAARVTGDYGIRVRDPGADQLTGSERRGYTFHDTVAEMVINARSPATKNASIDSQPSGRSSCRRHEWTRRVACHVSWQSGW